VLGIAKRQETDQEDFIHKRWLFMFGYSRTALFQNSQSCEKKNHVQQVVYSTYEKLLSQICFTEKVLRTTRNRN